MDLLKSENVDLQTKALSFINILLTHCSTIQEYKKRFSLFTQLTVPAVVSKLTADFEPLRVEIAAFRNIELDMSSSQQVSLFNIFLLIHRWRVKLKILLICTLIQKILY